MSDCLTPDYESTVKTLIKALEEYITVNDALRVAQVRAGTMSVCEAKADAAESVRFIEMVEDLRAFHYDAAVYEAMREMLGKAKH